MEIQVPDNWRPRGYQLPLWEYLENGGKRAVAVWHRRAGKDLLSINWCARAAIERVGLYWHLLPTYNQGRKIVWDGMTKDGRSFLEHFPKDLWSYLDYFLKLVIIYYPKNDTFVLYCTFLIFRFY